MLNVFKKISSNEIIYHFNYEEVLEAGLKPNDQKISTKKNVKLETNAAKILPQP